MHGSKNIKLIVKRLIQWYDKQGFEKFPADDPYKVLIACILSQRTRDANTERAYQRLFSKFRNVKEIANADVKEIEEMIRPAGFYKNKAKSIKEVSKIVLKKRKIPDNEEELKALPGVGQKTADITLCYGFGEEVIAVDIHVFRISKRIGLAEGNIKQVKKHLEEKIPKRYKRCLNHAFVRYGQNICLPRIPRCSKCVVEELCEKNGVERWK